MLDEWQEFVLREALGVRADGKWAAFSSCVIVPRQNGKGAVLEALALAALFQLDIELTVWTAHQMKTAKEGFRRLVAHIARTPDLMRQVAAIKRGNDDRGIELKDGRRIQFIARGTGGSGRGFTGDLLIFDEAYELDADTMADILPTLSAVPNPQVWYTSSAPMAKSEQLHSVRRRGVVGEDPRLAFFEWSVDSAGRLGDALTDFYRQHDQWALANPGFGVRISDESIESEWNELSADVDPAKFARERLGVPDAAADESQIVPTEVWDALKDGESRIESNRCWALAVSPIEAGDQWAAIGVAGRRADGRLHVEWMHHQAGTDWIVPTVVAGWTAKRIPIRIHKTGPEHAFISLLRERGVDVVEVSTGEVAQSVGQFVAAAKAARPAADDLPAVPPALHHLGQPALDVALRGAVIRTGSDGSSVWSQRSSQVEITPLVAVTVALGGVAVEQLIDAATQVW